MLAPHRVHEAINACPRDCARRGSAVAPIHDGGIVGGRTRGVGHEASDNPVKGPAHDRGERDVRHDDGRPPLRVDSRDEGIGVAEENLGSEARVRLRDARCCWEVARTGVAGDDRRASRRDGDCLPSVGVGAAEERGVAERGPGCVQLKGKGIAAPFAKARRIVIRRAVERVAAEARLERVDRRKVRRSRLARDVGVAGGVDRDARASVRTRAADVSRIAERSEIAPEFDNERVPSRVTPVGLVASQTRSTEAALKCAGGRGEVAREGGPDDQDISVAVDGQAVGDVGSRAAEVSPTEEFRSGRVELGDERVGRTSAVGRLLRVPYGPVALLGQTGDDDVARRVDRDGLHLARGGVCVEGESELRPWKGRREKDLVGGLIELEDVAPRARRGESACRWRDLSRACYDDLSRGIERDPDGRARQVGRENEVASRCAELQQESRVAGALDRLQGVDGREVGRSGRADDVRLAGGVNRDPEALFPLDIAERPEAAAAADVG